MCLCIYGEDLAITCSGCQQIASISAGSESQVIVSLSQFSPHMHVQSNIFGIDIHICVGKVCFKIYTHALSRRRRSDDEREEQYTKSRVNVRLFSRTTGVFSCVKRFGG